MDEMMEYISFIENLQKIAREDGSRNALVHKNGLAVLSYREFDRLSSAVADKLNRSGIESGDVVIVMMRRNAFSIAAEVGVLKAGAVFVPVVPAYPEDRISYIKKDCNAKLILDEDFFSDISEYDSDFKPVKPQRDMVMLVYTSGSTGYPKGVVYDLRAYNHTVERLATQYDGIDPVIQAAFAPMAFVAHLSEFAAVFYAGGTAHVIEDSILMDPVKLTQYYISNHISIGFIAAKIFQMMNKPMPDLQKVILGGEKISDIAPGPYHVIADYAMTEAMDMMRYRVDGLSKEAFLGDAVAGTQIFLMDENGNEVSGVGEGEICARGIYPRRYLNLPEETGKTFEETADGQVIVHTGDIGSRHQDGSISYVNRRDFMVKINGNKVDPSETERVLKKLPGVKEAVVKPVKDAKGKLRLCGYYMADKTLQHQDLKAFLKDYLPGYMIPSFFVSVESFPKTSTGKLDRGSLPEPVMTRSDETYIAPKSDEEIKLCRIIERVLNIEKAGLNDNFFDLGADSLQAAQLVIELEREGMGIVEVKQIYEFPILSDLLKIIINSRLTGNYDYTVFSNGKNENIPVIFYHTANMGVENYRVLSQMIPAEIPFIAFNNHNLNYPDIPIKDIRTLQNYYKLIASDWISRFEMSDNGARIFGGWSFGGILAFEAALNAEKAGERVAGVILIDPFLMEERDREKVLSAAFDPNIAKYFEELKTNVSKDVKDVDLMIENNKLVARMLADYKPAGELSAKVLFIKANVVRDTDTVKALCQKYPANGYEKYCKNIEIISIDCNHDELGNNEEALRYEKEFIIETALKMG
jgi:acyl-coenzyme A synthetase/AMP-(fatty) acid ligase/thioesterase domain-containing protein/acyl carrier protein